MSKVKVVFDRIWKTAMIVVNTAFGLLLVAFAFSALSDRYFAEYHWDEFLISVAAIAAVNTINWLTRKHFKEY